MNDSEKIYEIGRIMSMFHRGEDENGFEMDCIDALMKIDDVLLR